MAFTPEQLALVSRYSPSYQAALAHESASAYDEELAKQQAAEQAESMKGNREQYLGNPNVRLGLPSVDPRYQTKQPTGYYAEGVDPMRRFQAERNFAQGTSGVPALADRGLDNESAMQDSLNSNINTIAQARWKKENIPQKPTTPNAYQEWELAKAQGYPGDFVQYKRDMKASGTTVTVEGDQALTPGWMSDEVKAEQGIPASQSIWIDGKGVPKTINKQDVGQQKADVALSQMEAATKDMNQMFLNDYNPNSPAEYAGALLDLNPVVANMLRSQSERTMNSAKKGWAEMVLRDATGAVINPSEYKDYDTIYMPQPGETPEEWEIKAKRRHDKENAYRTRLGKPTVEYVSPYAGKSEEEGEEEKRATSPVDTTGWVFEEIEE